MISPSKLFDVPEVLEVHEVPSDEVRMVPYSPVATKIELPYATPPPKFLDVPEVLEVHVTPSDEVRMVPE